MVALGDFAELAVTQKSKRSWLILRYLAIRGDCRGLIRELSRGIRGAAFTDA